VADTEPGPKGANPGGFVISTGRASFGAPPAALGQERGRTDGTAPGTRLVKDIGSGTQDGLSTSPLDIAASYGGLLYFSADGGSGQQLWKSDGTVAGTTLALDAAGGAVGRNPRSFQVMGGQLFFGAETAATGRELWRVRGGSIQLVQDLVSGGMSGLAFEPELTVLGAQLVFVAKTSAVGLELFVTDGTSAGTGLLADIDPGPGGSAPVSLTLDGTGGLLCGAAMPSIGAELWRVASGSATLLKDLDPGQTTAGSQPSDLAVHVGSELYFAAFDGTNGLEPWKWSAASGMAMVADIAPGNGSSLPANFFDAWIGDHQVTFFTAEDSLGTELWRTDGTAAGTQRVRDIWPGPGSSQPTSFAGDGQRVFFAATTPGQGTELWASDGTTAGTLRVKDILPGFGGSLGGNLVSFQGKVYFPADDGQHGAELWSSDGTTLGTQMLADLFPVSSLPPSHLTVLGNQLFFTVFTLAAGEELWVTDGTAIGTHLVVDLDPGGAGASPEDLVVMGGALYFSASTTNHGRELWRVDGTTLAASLVAETILGPEGGKPQSLTAAGDRLFFTARAPGTGRELWVTDGQPAGTHFVVELATGLASGIAENAPLLPAGGGVYFPAGTLASVGDVELTFSDGTPAGTQRVCDLAPGHVGSLPKELVLVDGQLVFAAANVAFGTELFHMPMPGASAVDLGPASAPQRLDATEAHLGATSRIDVSGILPGDVGFLLMSAPAPAQPSPLVVLGNASWIDPASGLVVHLFAGPTGSLTQPIPTAPTLAGLAIDLQVWATVGGALPLTTSNGLRLVLDV
jgi:ELWxxDGT repeat protein